MLKEVYFHPFFSLTVSNTFLELVEQERQYYKAVKEYEAVSRLPLAPSLLLLIPTLLLSDALKCFQLLILACTCLYGGHLTSHAMSGMQ